MSEEPHVLIDRDGHIVTVTLNRPEAKNAISAEMVVRMADAWTMIDEDDEIRVAILTGAGNTFCAGADLKAMSGGYGENEWTERCKADPDLPWKALLRHYRLKKPLIAAVEGSAIAGGTEILQATDIRVAARGAKFGVSEVRWGLYPLGGSPTRLPRQIPFTQAMDILLTGKHISAEEALQIGLISRVCEDGEALSTAKEVAQIVADNGPLAVQAVKKAVLETNGMEEKEALAHEYGIGLRIFATEDSKIGPKAFAKKEKPQFKGR